MPALTHNLFWGRGPGDHRLRVTHGAWPGDMDGSVFVVGPDKRRPGGHWFAEQGMLLKIGCAPDTEGRIPVSLRRIETPVSRLRRRLPFLFARRWLMELSPFGFTNFANTNVQPLRDRLFVGYDVGRPVEVDPESCRYLTAVGANDEWAQMLPAPFEPAVAVAAHPAPAPDEGALYFVNYSMLPLGDADSGAFVARWDLEGRVERWRVEGLEGFDSIHDVKATPEFLVISDLPFKVEPQTFRGAPRAQRNQAETRLWIVAKADLRETPPGGTVPAREIRLPFPTGHLVVDPESPPGEVVLWLQHIPLQDLTLTLDADQRSHAMGTMIDPNYEGLITLGVQPAAIGRYRIDVASGEVRERVLASDPERFWGGLLFAWNVSRDDTPERPRWLWYGGMGFDPALVPESWWRLYGDVPDAEALVPPRALPAEAKPGALACVDLESMKVAQLYAYADGAFPHPPTFVPKRAPKHPGDGYVVVVVHRDAPKEVQVFDAMRIEQGPIARATAPDFNPPLMLHSCWMPPRRGPRPSRYHVSVGRDLAGALRRMPAKLVAMARFGLRVLRGEVPPGVPGFPPRA